MASRLKTQIGKSGWWPADELNFIREIIPFCNHTNRDPKDCLLGYLKSIHLRKDWGRFIREDDIEDFITEAHHQLRQLQ
tara:strand:- start:695 stop:931 length:237 start_codon:yes stop_codon:yes gene_type:complete